MNPTRKTATNWLSAIGYRLSAIGYRLILGVLVCFFAAQVQASPYRASADGSVVLDQATGLVWMRCAIGQMWNGNTCTGTSEEYNLEQAQRKAEQFNEQGGFAGFKDWVVPTARQLIALRLCAEGLSKDTVDLKDGGRPISKKCAPDTLLPAIDTNIFPDGRSGQYMSSSHVDGEPFMVGFGNSYVNQINRRFTTYLRLVRVGQSYEGEVATAFPVRLAVMSKTDIKFAVQKSKILVGQLEKDDRDRIAREDKQAEENRRREAYVNSPAGRAEAQRQQQGRQMCEAQKQTCKASCPQWRDGANNYAAFSCEKDCQKISCN